MIYRKEISKNCRCEECWQSLMGIWEKFRGPEVWPAHFHSLTGLVNVSSASNVGVLPKPSGTQQKVDNYNPLRCGKDPLVDAPRLLGYNERQASGGTHCDCTNCCQCTGCTGRRKDGC